MQGLSQWPDIKERFVIMSSARETDREKKRPLLY
jgi:hypothetical protein